jgi:hypothetical protein
MPTGSWLLPGQALGLVMQSLNNQALWSGSIATAAKVLEVLLQGTQFAQSLPHMGDVVRQRFIGYRAISLPFQF